MTVEYVILPSFVSATYRKIGDEVHVLIREEIRGTTKELATIAKINPNKREGLIIN